MEREEGGENYGNCAGKDPSSFYLILLILLFHRGLNYRATLSSNWARDEGSTAWSPEGQG